MKSYYRTLSGSHGRSFKICHENSPEAPPSEEIMVTSYPACNNTSLSRKSFILDKTFLENVIRSHASSIRIRHENSPEAPPSGEITMTWYPACNNTSLSRKPCNTNKKLLWISIRKSCSLFQSPSWIIIWSAPRLRNHDDVIPGMQKNLVISKAKLHR